MQARVETLADFVRVTQEGQPQTCLWWGDEVLILAMTRKLACMNFFISNRLKDKEFHGSISWVTRFRKR